jgi:phosphoenolpyruvate carboxylase
MSTFDYPEAWSAFWHRHRGAHSMLRCPGEPCPGGCGAGAKDDLAAIQDARRGRDMTDEQRRRITWLLQDWHAHQAGERERARETVRDLGLEPALAALVTQEQRREIANLQERIETERFERGEDDAEKRAIEERMDAFQRECAEDWRRDYGYQLGQG